jgi:hypothetical protein
MGFIGKNRVYKDILLGGKRVERSLAMGKHPSSGRAAFPDDKFLIPWV